MDWEAQEPARHLAAYNGAMAITNEAGAHQTQFEKPSGSPSHNAATENQFVPLPSSGKYALVWSLTK
jgi:hypothetical protein